MARKSRRIMEIAQEIPPVVEMVFLTAIYTRLSIEDTRDGEGGSLEDQICLGKKFVSEKPYLKLIKVYSDNGQTGTNFDRPDFERLMEDIRKGLINCIVVKDLSRFARNYIEADTYIEKVFPFLGVRFISIGDNYDSFDPCDNGEGLVIALKNLMKNISRSGKVSNDFSLFRQFCCINRCFRCSCGKFAIVHGVQAAIGFLAAAIGEKGDLPETHPVQPRTESRHPCRSTRAKPASKGLGRALSV